MSRLNAKVRCNYYPLPLREAERIRNLLRFPIELFSALDPCVGDGAAFATITSDSSARRYGIELDAYRAEQAGPSLTKIVQGNCLETHCAVESFSLCFCNPPYDWALAGNARERLETVFLNHIFRWLIPGGVLLLVIPAERATDRPEPFQPSREPAISTTGRWKRSTSREATIPITPSCQPSCAST